MEPEVLLLCPQEPATGPILSQIHPIHKVPSYFPKIHSDITLPSTPSSSKWSLPFRFPKS
jgi:hypothetical protein